MFLESQFGTNLVPISRPKLPPQKSPPKESTPIKPEPGDDDDENGSVDMETDEADIEELEDQELKRLHALGIPVPGIEIRVDKHVARLWLETLEVECGYGVLRDRVKVAVEKAVETVAPLWGGGGGAGSGGGRIED